MLETDAASRDQSIAIWLISMLTLGFLGAVVVALTHTEFLDCSVAETHESANTPLGWSMALIATVTPLVVGVVLGARHVRWLIAITIAVAGVQSLIWVWALTTPGDCGATAFLWTSLTA